MGIFSASLRTFFLTDSHGHFRRTLNPYRCECKDYFTIAACPPEIIFLTIKSSQDDVVPLFKPILWLIEDPQGSVQFASSRIVSKPGGAVIEPERTKSSRPLTMVLLIEPSRIFRSNPSP